MKNEKLHVKLTDNENEFYFILCVDASNSNSVFISNVESYFFLFYSALIE